MAGLLAPTTDVREAGAPIAEGPFQELTDTLWERPSPLVGLVQGHWRWREVADGPATVRGLLARRFGPGTIPFNPERAHRFTLPPRDPSSRPCEVALYPTVVFLPDGEARTESGPGPVYLCLFYSFGASGGPSASADRARAYYRVVEALDRLHDELRRQYPHRDVRAIDLPMPGWMSAQLCPVSGNTCPLVSS